MGGDTTADVEAFVDDLKRLAARIDAQSDESETDELKELVSRLEQRLNEFDDTEPDEHEGVRL